MHLLRLLRLGRLSSVFYDAPDGNAGGGGNDPAGDGSGDASHAGDLSDGEGDAGADAGGDDDAADSDDEDLILGADDDDEANRLSEREQLARLRKAHRKLKKRHLKDRTEYQTAKSEAEQWREFQRDLRQNPARLRALINGGGDGNGREPTRPEPAKPARPALPAELTPDALGFDPRESTANTVLANAVQVARDLAARVEQLEALQPQVRQLTQHVASRTAREEQGSWEKALSTFEGELKKVAPGNELLMTLARDAMHGAYQTRRTHRRAPQQIVDHYLKGFVKAGQLTKREAVQVSAATQSRMAQHNRTLPRSPAGGGEPSNAKGDERLTLKDVHKRLRAGQIGPR